MNANPFVDTNVWVYAHLKQPGEPRHRQALELLENAAKLVISTQVLGEYYHAMLRNRISDSLIVKNLAAMIAICEVRPVDLAVVHGATGIRQRYGFSWWDSQLLAAALAENCDTFYSGDMQAGQVIEGRLQIVNPFKN